jgi:D-alanine transaminase
MASLESVPAELLRRNGLDSGDATIYVQISRGAAPRSHPFPTTKINPTIYASASPFEPLLDKWKHGIKVICVPDIRWARCDIKTISLLANVMANQQALDANADEALFVRDGAVTEGTVSNFGAVFDGHLWTYPESNYILPGITRQVVLELCDQLNIPVQTRPIMVERLHRASEALVMGTTKEVTPVIQIDNHVIGGGTPGPVTLKLQQAFNDLINP